MEKDLNWREFIITRLIKFSGYSAIIFVSLIFFFLLKEGLPTLTEVPLGDLFSLRWYPIESYYGILPLITGSLLITIGAGLIAVPFGIGTAVYLAEIALLRGCGARCRHMATPKGRLGWGILGTSWNYHRHGSCNDTGDQFYSHGGPRKYRG